MRNQDGFYYESDFRQGNIPGFTTIDAMISYKFPKTRSMLKLGSTNLTNKYYKHLSETLEIKNAYLSFGYNVF